MFNCKIKKKKIISLWFCINLMIFQWLCHMWQTLHLVVSDHGINPPKDWTLCFDFKICEFLIFEIQLFITVSFSSQLSTLSALKLSEYPEWNSCQEFERWFPWLW